MLQYFKPVLKRTRCLAPDGVDRFYSRTRRAVVPARDAAAAVSCVFTNAARCSASWARDWWALSPQNAAALCRHGNLVVQRDTRTTAGVGAYDDPAAPSPFQTCDFAARFPTWLPLDKWLPQVFVASGDCSVRQWQFLSLEMPQWLVGIFAAYLLVAILVIVAQPFKAKNAICLVVKPRRVQPTMKRPAGRFFFYASCASLNRFMSMVDHSCQRCILNNFLKPHRSSHVIFTDPRRLES